MNLPILYFKLQALVKDRKMRRRVTKNTVRASEATGKRDERDKIGREFPVEEKMPKLKGKFNVFLGFSHKIRLEKAKCTE